MAEPTSPQPDVPQDEVVVGRILAPHGTTGEVRVEVLSDVPRRFRKGAVLRVNGRPLTIERVRSLAPMLALKFEGVATLEAAKALTGADLTVPASDVPALKPGQYYHYQIVGLDVVTTAGERIGCVAEVLSTGSNDVYVVATDDGKEILLPAIPDVIRAIDLPAKRMIVELLPGLR